MEPTSALAPRGFTLVELVVVLAIIVVLTAVVINGQNNFDRTLTVTDTAYTVALSVRQAQTFGLSSRAFSGITNAAYGAHFLGATPKTYQIFADIYPVAPGTASAWCPGHTGVSGSPDAKPGNCTYDSTQSELIQNYTFGRGFTLSNLCGHDSATTLHCTSASSGATVDLNGVDVVFLRPNTDSIVTGLRGIGNISLIDAQITLTAPAGGSRYICITKVGEVSVATSTCP